MSDPYVHAAHISASTIKSFFNGVDREWEISTKGQIRDYPVNLTGMRSGPETYKYESKQNKFWNKSHT